MFLRTKVNYRTTTNNWRIPVGDISDNKTTIKGLLALDSELRSLPSPVTSDTDVFVYVQYLLNQKRELQSYTIVLPISYAQNEIHGLHTKEDKAQMKRLIQTYVNQLKVKE